MLNRRHLRIKVLQMLYTFYNQKESMDLKTANTQLLESVDLMYDLYLYLLLAFQEVKNASLSKMEDRANKLRPSFEDLNPNRKFVDNSIVESITNSNPLQDLCQRRNVNWKSDERQEIFRKLFIEIEKSEVYFEHMEAIENDFSNAKNFLVQLFRNEIANSPLVYNFFEEEEIRWMDDIDLACSMVIKTIKNTKDEGPFEFLPLYKDNDDEKEFITTLLKQTVAIDQESEKMIAELADNWELDRIAKMDVLLLKMAFAELQSFESIPTKVTINEYLEISKYYSTPKSNVFINGILDKSLKKMTKDKKIVKTGRGLKQ
ncbi:MAG: transcription antitermination protein NusB [Crocinitomicaceae bacterium]|nr:transcription antitermination protein NusB [Crocinitomicaceae bacterium]